MKSIKSFSLAILLTVGICLVLVPKSYAVAPASPNLTLPGYPTFTGGQWLCLYSYLCPACIDQIYP